MKRFLLTLTCVISVLYLFPMFIKAYNAPDGNEYKYKITTVTINRVWWMTLYGNDKVCFCESAKSGTDYYAIGKGALVDIDYIGIISSDTSGIDCTINGVYPNNVGTISSNYKGFYHDDLGNYQNANFPCNVNDYPDIPIFSTYEECYNYLTTPDIDYDTVYYSPLIPNVDFNVVLNTSGVPVNEINSIYNAFNINIKSNIGTDYYIQIGYKAHVPNKMALGVNNNGTAYYSAITYNNATYQDIYSLSDNQVAFTGSVNNSLFTWNRQEVSSSNWVITSNLDGQTSFVNGSISAYNDLMSYIMPLYGKKLEIFMRYYVIQDNQVIVGAWSHWNNTYPQQYTQELPSNYVPYHDIPGLEQTNNNTSLQDNSDSISTIGQTTGTPSVTVYNSNVPNYPDYPTAVSYNHDNVLLQFIETTTKLPSFFGDFTEFCKQTLTILPPEIWEIIGFGFLCSIVVMIVKVL